MKTYDYDATGNRTGGGYVVDAGNQIKNDGTFTYAYDAVGNRTLKTAGASAETWNYEYDHLNHLIHIDGHSAGSGGTNLGEVTYKYDVFGNRLSRDQFNGVPYAPVNGKYAYDGWKVQQDFQGNRASFVGQENWDVWADFTTTYTLDTRRVYGDGVDQLLSRVSGADVAWYHTDTQGSVTALTDGTVGLVQNEIAYNGYGDVTSESNASVGDRYGYTAREEDVGGLMFYRDRVLAMDLGQFITRDRKGFAAGDMNLVRYVSNGFTNGVDPSGMDWIVNGKENAEAWSNWLSRGDHGTGITAVSHKLEHLDSDEYQIVVPIDQRENLQNLLTKYAGKYTDSYVGKWVDQTFDWTKSFYLNEPPRAGSFAKLQAISSVLLSNLGTAPEGGWPLQFDAKSSMKQDVSGKLTGASHIPRNRQEAKAQLQARKQSLEQSSIPSFLHGVALLSDELTLGGFAMIESGEDILGEVLAGNLLTAQYKFQSHLKGAFTNSSVFELWQFLETPAFPSNRSRSLDGSDDPKTLSHLVREYFQQTSDPYHFELGQEAAAAEELLLDGLLPGVSEGVRQSSKIALKQASKILRRQMTTAEMRGASYSARAIEESATHTGGHQISLSLPWEKTCFAAGTPILTPTGSRTIESLQVGEQVFSRAEDDLHAKIVGREIEETFIRSALLLDLVVGGRTIRTTGEHPFYVRDRGWLCASDLNIGDQLVSHEGQWIAVQQIKDNGSIATVYNIRVAVDHTYFVGDVDWGFSVWVHNADYVIENVFGRYFFKDVKTGNFGTLSFATREEAETVLNLSVRAKLSGQLGREGEALASELTGAPKNTELFLVNGRGRIPDQVLAMDIATKRPSIVAEVKNVKRQAFTRQLRDDIELVGPSGQVNVYLPPGAEVTKPLGRAFANPRLPLNRLDLVPPQ